MTTNLLTRARPFRILVVDDETTIRTFAERILTDAGYAVDAVASGPAALAVVEHEGTFDLFVIDMVMPDMHGVELARQLRARHPDAKVLYFTGNADRLFLEKSTLWDSEAFLEKPVSVTALREAVSLLLFKHTLGPALNPLTPRRSATVIPDQTCAKCGALLTSPDLAPDMAIPPTADFVCVPCGRAYALGGNPPRLTVVLPASPRGEDDK